MTFESGGQREIRISVQRWVKQTRVVLMLNRVHNLMGQDKVPFGIFVRRQDAGRVAVPNDVIC